MKGISLSVGLMIVGDHSGGMDSFSILKNPSSLKILVIHLSVTLNRNSILEELFLNENSENLTGKTF